MIDPADKKTAALPLEQPKRGRGRPVTGEALTPAQKQKAYRERLKSNVTKNVQDDSQISFLSRLLDQERENTERLANKVLELERQLKELKKSNVTKIKKHRDDAPLETIKAAHSQMEERRKSGELNEIDALWRFVGATLQTLEQHGIKEAE